VCELHSLQEPPVRPPKRTPRTCFADLSTFFDRRQDIKDKGSMQARWRINAPAVMDIPFWGPLILDIGYGNKHGDETDLEMSPRPLGTRVFEEI